jgi:U3 small nucleolar RNA-associated protein 10
MDTAAFIAECAEDDNDEVAKAARSLRRSVEAVAGSMEAVLS